MFPSAKKLHHGEAKTVLGDIGKTQQLIFEFHVALEDWNFLEKFILRYHRASFMRSEKFIGVERNNFVRLHLLEFNSSVAASLVQSGITFWHQLRMNEAEEQGAFVSIHS